MKNSTLSVVVSAFFFLFSAVWLFHCRTLDFSTSWTLIGGPGTFPFLVLLVMTVGFCIVAAKEYLKMRRGDDTQGTDPASCKRIAALLAATVAYVLFIEFTGYILATALLLLASLLLFGERDKRVLVAVSVLFPAALWFLFQQLLEVQLP